MPLMLMDSLLDVVVGRPLQGNIFLCYPLYLLFSFDILTFQLPSKRSIQCRPNLIYCHHKYNWNTAHFTSNNVQLINHKRFHFSWNWRSSSQMVMDLIIYMDHLLHDLYYIPLFIDSGMTYKFIISVNEGVI